MSYDVACFRDNPAGAFADQVLADAQDSGRTLSGMEKLVQRFVLQLLTRSGSVPFADIGCDFVSRLTTGRLASETDVFLAFTSSVGQVVDKLRAEEVPGDPDSERLASVQIISLTIAPGALQLELRLQNRTATALNVTLPLHFLLM